MKKQKKSDIKNDIDLSTIENLVVKESKTLSRYDVRNTLFRVRDDRVENKELADLIWNSIKEQLKPDENLSNFTFAWDVQPDKPMIVIRRNEWDEIKKEKYPDHYKRQSKVDEEVTLFTGQK